MRVYELSFEQYPIARPLFAAAHFDEACHEAVFLGWNPARIFVDDPIAPRAALMARSYEYFLAGDSDTALTAFIADAPAEVGIFQYLYGFAPLTPDWARPLESLLPLERVGRCNYRWMPGTPIDDWRARLDALNGSGMLPGTAQVVPMDETLARRADSDPGMYPVPFVRYFWRDYALYDRYGYGMALLIDDAIATTVFALCTSPRDAIISIDTRHEFQRRGLGWITSSAFIEETLRRGLLPVWDCDEFNLPSFRLADRLGFVQGAPFFELAMPERAPLPLTTGRWGAVSGGWARVSE